MRTALLFLCSVPALPALAAAQQRILDSVLPADAPVTIGDQVWQACRVVDAVTGAPIAGAELFLVQAHDTPLAGQFWQRRVATSGADGFVRVRSDDLKEPWHAMVLRAKGYGTAASGNVVPGLVWALSPGLDLPIELRDWAERPIPMAKVGLCLGQGNLPDVANATTDAAGRAVLVGVDPNSPTVDVYPEGPELGLVEYGRVEWAPGEPAAIVRIASGVPVRGTVLDHAGKPMASVFVGAPHVHRGPWCQTAADGSFHLEGAPADADLTVLIGRQAVRFERPDTEPPFTLQVPELPAPKPDSQDDSPAEEAEPQGRRPQQGGRRSRRPPPPIVVDRAPLPEGPMVAVELRVADQAGKAIDQLEVATLGPLPRRRAVEESVRDGVLRCERLPGRYEVVCRSPGYEAKLGTIEVRGGQLATAMLTAVPWARLAVHAERRAELGSISLRTAEGSGEITAEFGEDGNATIAVPNQATFCFVVGNDTGVNVVRTTWAEAKAAQPFVLRGIARTRVTGQVVGPDGKSVSAVVGVVGRFELLRAEGGFDARTADLVACADGAVQLDSKHTGLAFVVAVPQDPLLRPALVPVVLPPLGTAETFAVGKIAVASKGQLQVLGADGQPLAAAKVGLIRTGWHDVREVPPTFPTDNDGTWLAPVLRAGDAVVVPSAPFDIERDVPEGQELVVDLPFRTVLQGDGPWQVQVPAGEVVVTTKGKGGAAVLGRLFVGDRCIAVPGKVRLRQVPLGKLEVVCAAIDHQPIAASIEVKAGAIAELVLDLPEQ